MPWSGATIAGYSWVLWLEWAWILSSLALAIWIILQQRAPVSTLAWIMLLSLLPGIGIAIYAYFGPQRVKRQRLKRWHTRAALMSQRDIETLREHRPNPPLWAQQHSRLIEASCGLPLCSTHGVRLLARGGDTLDALLDAVASAHSHVHMEYYIFEPDQTGHLVLAALAQRARQGVHVRLLLDAIGSSRLLSRRHRAALDPLREAGGEIAVFHRTRLDRLRPLVNLRTHRKIVVVDGRVGMLGGMNITDQQNERVQPDAAFRDTHLVLHGSAVRWLQYVFLLDWFYASGRQPAQADEILPRTEAAANALTNAALRGVQVKIMLPEKSDSRVMTAAARSYYREMQMAGVLVHEYLGRMFHAKTLVVDQQYSMIGSANFDNRSFRLNFEVAAVLFDHEVNRQLAALFEQDLQRCKLVSIGRRIMPQQRLFEAVARLGSPLL